jgi:hypothetical protein
MTPSYCDNPFCNSHNQKQTLEPTPEYAEGIKFDSDKPSRPELISPEMIQGISTVLGYGAKKYAARNWEKGMSWGRVFGALMRHLWAWWAGEGKDKETGYSHLWHAGCCLMFLIAYEERGVGKDDRKVQHITSEKE